jgi:TldD protein
VVLVARSDGHLAADIRPLVRVSVTVIMKKTAAASRARRAAAGATTTATSATRCSAITEALHQARVNLGAGPAPAGEMTVVLGPAGPASCCTRPSATAWKATSTARELRLRRPHRPAVAAKGVTVVDDGTLADRRGSLTIDDEGNPTQRTLIEDGILKGYMQDSSTRA